MTIRMIMMKVSQMIQKIDEGCAKLSKGGAGYNQSRIYIEIWRFVFISYPSISKLVGSSKIHAPPHATCSSNVQSTVYVILEDVIVTKVTKVPHVQSRHVKNFCKQSKRCCTMVLLNGRLGLL